MIIFKYMIHILIRRSTDKVIVIYSSILLKRCLILRHSRFVIERVRKISFVSLLRDRSQEMVEKTDGRKESTFILFLGKVVSNL